MQGLGFLALLTWVLFRAIERAGAAQEDMPAPPQPLLSLHARPCPFCGGQSKYIWVGSREGGHRLTCYSCREIYSSNLGGETRWAIATASGAELCYATSPEMAQDFIARALSRVAPGASFQIRFGADGGTPYIAAYWNDLQRMVGSGDAGNRLAH